MVCTIWRGTLPSGYRIGSGSTTMPICRSAIRQAQAPGATRVFGVALGKATVSCFEPQPEAVPLQTIVLRQSASGARDHRSLTPLNLTVSHRYYVVERFPVHRFIGVLAAQRNPVDSFRTVGSLSTRVKMRTVGVSFCQPAPLITFFVPVSGPFGFFFGLFS